MTGATVSMHVVSLPWRQAWRGLTLISKDKRMLASLDGVRFAVNGRTCGGGGTRDVNMSLTLRREVVLIEWDSSSAMTAGRAQMAAVWSECSAEVWSASLVPLRAKGTWRNAGRFSDSNDEIDAQHEFVAALTYGKVKIRRTVDFYLRGFPATASNAVGPESRMVAGIGFAGSVPVRHPCTFSFWRTSADVSRFAYGPASPHGDVQRRAIQDGWFVESAFARFAVVDHAGSWAGSDPLA